MAQSLNKRYLNSLHKNPLLTKCVTAAVLAVLNEVIASGVAREFKVSTVLNVKVKHTLSWKLPIFALFSAGVGAPITHYGYQWLNALFKSPLTLRQKIIQIVLSMATLTPLMSTLFVAFVSLVNMTPKLRLLALGKGDELERAWTTVKSAWKKSLLSVLKSSWITGPVVIAVCQRFLEPELWVGFNQLCYFVLGTGQNTMLKLRTKKQQEYLKKKEELKDEVEKLAEDTDSNGGDVMKASTTSAVEVHELDVKGESNRADEESIDEGGEVLETAIASEVDAQDDSISAEDVDSTEEGVSV